MSTKKDDAENADHVLGGAGEKKGKGAGEGKA